jgi:hypothetical protein
MEGNECTVGESAVPDGGGGFASIASSSLTTGTTSLMKRETCVIDNRNLSLQLL